MTYGQKNQRHYPSQHLAARIASNTLSADPAQAAIVDELDHLLDRLMAARSSRRFALGVLGTLLGRIGVLKKDAVKGLYIYGGVGRGKTMLMDMFHASVRVVWPEIGTAPVIWRLHFHDFMVLAQDMIHAARQKGTDDPIESAAAELAGRGRVICFDEMEVRDIADAMILARLFTGLFDKGVVVVATSNRHADELYKNGLHRDRFLPFIALLKQRCQMLTIADEGAFLLFIPQIFHFLRI